MRNRLVLAILWIAVYFSLDTVGLSMAFLSASGFASCIWYGIKYAP